jgi:drug/metabolite transporter (DMT)-like permease
VGVVYALISAFIYASYVVLSSRLAAGVPSLVAALHLAQASALVCGVRAVFRGGLDVPATAVAWGAIVALAVVSTVIALRAFLAGLARIGPARASVLSSLEVLVTMALAFAFLGERLDARQALGAALILGAVALQNLDALRRLRLFARRRSAKMAP